MRHASQVLEGDCRKFCLSPSKLSSPLVAVVLVFAFGFGCNPQLILTTGDMRSPQAVTNEMESSSRRRDDDDVANSVPPVLTAGTLRFTMPAWGMVAMTWARTTNLRFCLCQVLELRGFVTAWPCTTSALRTLCMQLRSVSRRHEVSYATECCFVRTVVSGNQRALR